MAVKVLAWNIDDSFSDASRAEVAAGFIAHQKPDVAVLSEAYAEGSERLLGDIQRGFEDRGYQSEVELYQDIDDRKDRHGIMVIARVNLLAAVNVVNLAGRSAMKLVVTDPVKGFNIDIFGVHLDDRSEQSRLAQVSSLLEQVDPENPTVVAGDLNSLHGQHMNARLLRLLNPLSKHLPKSEPGPDQGSFSLGRIGSMASRLGEMSSGETLKALGSADFHDVDAQNRRHTKKIVGRMGVQLDHIMLHDLEATDFHVHQHPLVSDHMAITAKVMGPCVRIDQ